MFTNVGWGELLVIGMVALIVLGPERLPEAARWLAGAVRKAKDFAGSAQQQLKDDFGADFDGIREPLAQLNELRGLGPRALVTKHLLDGDDSLLTGRFDQAAPAGVQQPAPQSKADIYRQSAADRSAGSAGTHSGSSAVAPTPGTPVTPTAGGQIWDADAT